MAASAEGLTSRGSKTDRKGSSTTESVSISDTSSPGSVSELPLKKIPGTYGIPFFGAIKDRLDYFWFQGVPKFYEARRDKYKSTVFRTNVPPGPPFFPDPRVIMLLDEKSYLALFDMSKVEKKDVFTGTYVPSVSLTGGYRVLAYVDPSEPEHAILKQYAFDLQKASASRFVPAFNAAMSGVLTNWEAAMKKDGKVAYADGIASGTFQFVVKSFTNRDPFEEGENSIGKEGPSSTLQWVLAQIAPITPVPVAWYLAPAVEIFAHTFRVPSILVKGTYNKLVNFFKTYGGELLDMGEKLELDREEALHNLIYIVIFNAWGGLNVSFPYFVKRLASTSAEYQLELAMEVRNAVADNGGQLNRKALGSMPLVESAVFEVLRIDSPVPYQYATAKKDFVLESHDAAFQIKKGEVLAGYMPLATRDPKVFDDAETFVPKRFMSAEGKALLKYVLWSNGPQTEEPSLSNKQCAGKNTVLLFCQLFVASIYSKFDTMQLDAKDTSNVVLKSSTS